MSNRGEDGTARETLWTVAYALIALVAVFAVLSLVSEALRDVLGVSVPCLVVSDPAAAAREEVERDLSEHQEEVRWQCLDQGGDPSDCRAEGRRARDRVISVEETSSYRGEGAAFMIETARGARYRVYEDTPLLPVYCADMWIDSVSRPE
jgi:hypothetical protein